MISFTIDLEDHHEAYAPDGRWVASAHKILDFCAAHTIRATFFAVGQASAAPDLLKRVAGEGHELALHSWRHMRLTQEDRTGYRPALHDAKKRFEDLTGTAVTGFRAPVFSLQRESLWAIDVLGELGFTYSSSIIAGHGAMGGFKGAPATPFLWAGGLIELPVPILSFGTFSLPFLGGVYLRYLPLFLVRMLAQHQHDKTMLWTYTHPYDCDDGEGFVWLKDGTPKWANIILMHNRKGFLEKLGKLLAGHTGEPLGTRVMEERFKKSLNVFWV